MTTLLWIAGIGIALVVLLLVLPILILMFVNTTPKGVRVEVSYPKQVKSATAFEMRITIHNELDKPRILHSVDFDNEFLNGIEAESITPAPADRSSMLGTTAFHFRQSVLPAQSFSFTLAGRAKSKGEYSGTIRAFVDSKDLKSQDTAVSITVE